MENDIFLFVLNSIYKTMLQALQSAAAPRSPGTFFLQHRFAPGIEYELLSMKAEESPFLPPAAQVLPLSCKYRRRL